MWLFSDIGFFSVVAHPEHAGAVVVRSRDQDDLRALRDRLLPDVEIAGPDDHRHPFRAIVSRDEWAYAVCRLAESIDYTEFGDPLDPRQDGGPLRD